jgi:hypothetical protein
MVFYDFSQILLGLKDSCGASLEDTPEHILLLWDPLVNFRETDTYRTPSEFHKVLLWDTPVGHSRDLV